MVPVGTGGERQEGGVVVLPGRLSSGELSSVLDAVEQESQTATDVSEQTDCLVAHGGLDEGPSYSELDC